MTDTTQGNGQDSAPATAVSAKAEKQERSIRGYVNAKGEPVDSMDDAHGATFVLLCPSGNVSYTETFDNPAFMRKNAILGWQTKLGNLANTVLTNKKNPGTPEMAAGVITTWIARASDPVDPQWELERTGDGGSRVDRDKLATATETIARANEAALVAAGKTVPTWQVIRDRLDSEPDYLTRVRNNTDIANEYARLVGKVSTDLASLI